MNEEVKRVAAMDIINKHREDKFLVFVHTKKTGYILQESLKQRGIVTEFHNADVSKDERERIEREFRSRDPQSLRVIIATSTLAMGLNLPARRVILVGLSRGMTLITSMEINQMIGRAGRIGLDIQGDAHILIDNTNAVEEIGLCKKIEPVTSKLGERKIFGFHIISEIAEKNIATIDDAVGWYLRSLLHHQSIFEAEGQARRFITETFDELEKYGAIKKSPTGYSATKIGLVASWYYLSPYDVTGWANNFKSVMSGNFTSEDIAWALSNIDSCMSDYELRLNDPLYAKLEYALQQRGRQMVGGVGKKAFAYYCILKNLDAEQREMHSIMAGAYGDMERISSAIKTLGNVSKMFDDCPNKHLLLELPYRLRYRTENVELVLIPGVGSVTARKMMGRRIFNCKELLMAQEMGQNVLTPEKWSKVKDKVKQIANIGYLNYLKYEDK
jgi:replicative superfamily II helicase